MLLSTVAQDKNIAGGRGQKPGNTGGNVGGRGGERDRDRQDNRRPQSGELNKDREERPPRGQNSGRRQRLPSKEKDRVSGLGMFVCWMCTHNRQRRTIIYSEL